MRILHTVSANEWGGAEIRTLTEVAGLLARGHEVRIACPSGSPMAARATSLQIPVIELPASARRGAARLTRHVGALRAMRRLIAAGGFDVIATSGPEDSWLAALACATLAGAPPIVRMHHLSAPRPRGPANRWLYMRGVSRVVTAGEAMRQWLVRDHGFDGRRIVSVPTGIDLGHFRPGDATEARRALELPDDGQPMLGIVASLRRSKGHHLLLEAIAGLGTPVRLLVIGDGPQRAVLAKQADSLLPSGRVHFAGRQAEVLTWLRALDAFVLPTLHEAVPQSLSQAMAVGLCCVTTSVGGIPEIATDDSVMFVPPGDVGALREAIERVIGDPALRVRLGARARAVALERCSIEAMLARIEQLYAEVASRSAP